MSLPFAEQAKSHLGDALYRYLLGRPPDLNFDTPDANETAFSRYRLVPRVLSGRSSVDISQTLCGRRFAGPIAVGPFAGDRVFHEAGLLPVARVCQRLSLPLMVSEETVTPLADLTAAHDACWLQLRAAGPFDRALRLADEAARCGAQGMVLTVLAPSHPNAGSRPGGFDIGAEIAQRGWPTIGSDGPGVAALPAWPQWRWEDVSRLAAHLAASGMSLIVKGILHPSDAVDAAHAGCAGVIVANIGLRQCGRWALALPALADIRANSSGAVLLDGGVRCGVDAIIACCLGADFAVVTRPVVTTLAGAGETALTSLLSDWLDQITAIASWLGVGDLGDLDASFLQVGVGS